MTIDVGIHQIDVELYHSDPAPQPSLSSSLISVMLEHTPAHFAALHPRLTKWPAAVDDGTERQNRGTVVHRLVLGEGKAFEPIDVPDFKTKDARAMRDNAIAAGHVPIKRAVYEQALEIASHIEANLRARFGTWPIGQSERTVIWKKVTEHFGEIYCRSLDDHLLIDDDGALIIDLKTTELSVNDFELSRKLASEGGDIQAAHYTEGIETLFPDLAGRVKFLFIVAEVDPPYQVRPAPMPEGWLTMARRQVDRAAEKFAKCLAEENWPGYEDVAALECPAWREQRWMNEELAEEA